MKWRELLIDEIHYTYGVTDHLMSFVRDEELDWKPEHGSNWMSMGQLLMHITDACGSTFEGLINGAWDIREEIPQAELEPRQLFPPASKLPSVESVSEARKLLLDDRKLALKSLRKCKESDLSGKFAPAPWTMTSMVLGQRLLHMVFHLNQHKDQLFYYLKMTGRRIDTCNLYGMNCRFEPGDRLGETEKNPYSI